MNGRGVRAGVCSVVIAVLVGAGCSDDKVANAPTTTTAADPWRQTVHYVDPDGRFALDFPAAPALTDEPDGPLVQYSLRAAAIDGWGFELTWSDAQPGAVLAATQAMRPQTAQENAARDGGDVTQQATVRMFGRDALEFTVHSRVAGQGLYRDRQMVLGGRLYELTVLQREGGRQAFDRFVGSFRLLEPPVQAGADFFARARSVCRAAFSSVPAPPAAATPAQRGAAVSKSADLYVSIAKTLATTPAAPGDQGDAAAMIDAMRRSVAPARRFAQAVSEDRADAASLGRATHSDTDLISQITARHGGVACA